MRHQCKAAIKPFGDRCTDGSGCLVHWIDLLPESRIRRFDHDETVRPRGKTARSTQQSRHRQAPDAENSRKLGNLVRTPFTAACARAACKGLTPGASHWNCRTASPRAWKCTVSMARVPGGEVKCAHQGIPGSAASRMAATRGRQDGDGGQARHGRFDVPRPTSSRYPARGTLPARPRMQRQVPGRCRLGRPRDPVQRRRHRPFGVPCRR